jgi:predicted MPP superfamily phosphohydrolase
MLFRLLPILLGALSHFLLYRWAVSSWPRLARHRRLYIAVVAALLVLGPVLRFIVVTKHHAAFAPLYTAVSIESITILLTTVPLAIIHGISSVVGHFTRRPAPAAPAEPAVSVAPPTAMTRRQMVEAVAGSSFLAATGSMLGWGMVRGRHAFQIDEVVVKIAGLPRVLDGYTIAQVSDIHVGAYIGERELDEGLSRVAEVRPDLVVATGDLVDFDASFAPLVARRLADLRARDGVAAILGNHDHYTGAAKVTDALRAAGVDILVNAGKHVRPDDGGGFALLGVDDMSASQRSGGGPILARADAMVVPGIPRILLSHRPQSIDLWAGRVPLQLSGHTHGGQINPGFRPADLIMSYVAGRFEVRGTTLYVNRGFGTVGPPARVGAPPEVTKVVLVAG